MIKKITIEQLKEGFLCTDEENERYAVSSLLPWIERFFQITTIKTQSKINTEIPETETDKTISVVMHPIDLKLQAFEYDKDKMQKYQSISFQEMSDGRVILNYGGSCYYTSKDAVMQIPYPFPTKYFSKENGWSSSVEMAFKLYRKYLAEQEEQNNKITNVVEQSDDYKYKSYGLSRATRVDKDQEYTKIEGEI